MLSMKYTNKGLDFKTESLFQELMKNECLNYSNQYEEQFHFTIKNKQGQEKTYYKEINPLSWHHQIKYMNDKLEDSAVIDALKDWGLEVDSHSVKSVQHVLNSKKKRHRRNEMSIDEIKMTPRYKHALQMVENQFGGTLSDGKILAPYQKEGAALMMANERVFLCFEMGLGKTITSLVGALSNPVNERILIITMSRNLNDWIREIKVLGYEDDYIQLKSPIDLSSNKRIHLVSYEKWSHDRIAFKSVLNSSCQQCDSKHSYNQNLQYCHHCKLKAEPSNELYTMETLPEECPCCSKQWKKKSMFCSCGFSVIKSRKKSLSSYFHRGYDAAIVDEGHYLKNGDSKRSKSIVRKVKTKRRTILTGTPAENGTVDLYWQLAWLTGCESSFENPFHREPFKGYGKMGAEHFRIYYGGGHNKTLLETDSIQARVSHQEELWKLLDTLMIRKNQQDRDVENFIRVPKPRHIRRHLEMIDADRKLYEDILRQFREWYINELNKKEAAIMKGKKYQINAIEVCTWLTKLRQAASCPWTFKEYQPSKLEQPTKIRYLIDKAKGYLKLGKKMLIFTSHKATAEQLGILLDGIIPGKQAGYIHGSVDMKYRFDLMNRFQDPNDNLSILVMTTRTGAESYTLTEAKAVFIYDMEFNAKKLQQCYSRAVRWGQTSVVDIHWMISVNTIDVNMHGLILSKQSGVDMAIDRQELDFSQVAKEFEGDEGIEPEDLDYEAFAADMLAAGTKREEIFSVS
ncbi:DEAD/DEAH box helicase [Bacillus sp. UMB0728]|uniref:DEAD/DEAH box helicase n=1 Tax=Bacillus sp. UMB0728 TaxID=2066052 RepID=UPI002153968C|nr:DEAD/DEAH box helicase [Bacillus sp. UMB0728]